MQHLITTQERLTKLAACQAAKMSRSAHAFVRGNTEKHDQWLEKRHQFLPDGPPVWICGDRHLGSLGPVASKNDRIDIQIHDLDQTVIGNPAHDLVRLTLSLASAARGADLPAATTARMIEEMITGYELGIETLDDDDHQPPEPNVVKTVRQAALGRKWHHLAKERIRDLRPSIPLGERFWQLSEKERWNVGVFLVQPAIQRFILSLNRPSEAAKIELIDTAYWVKERSSLGKLRLAALVHVSGERKEKTFLN